MSVDSVLIFARERRDFWSGWSVVAGARETRRKPAQPAGCATEVADGTTEVAEPWRRDAHVSKEFVKCPRFFLNTFVYSATSKVEQKLSLEFSAPSRPTNGKPDSLHPCGAARWCREPYSGAISPRVSAEKAGPLSSG